MGLYGKTSILAVDYFYNSKAKSPRQAWDMAVIKFTDSYESQQKGCPRSAFLGLCEAGVVRQIPSGDYGAPVDNKNGAYALKAYRILQSNPSLKENPQELWATVIAPENTSENRQMDVVISLWNEKLLK